MLPETLTGSAEHGPDAMRIQVAVIELAAHHTALVPDHQEPPAVKGVELTKLLLVAPTDLPLTIATILPLTKGVVQVVTVEKVQEGFYFFFRKSFFENACGKTFSHYNKTIL